MNLFRLGIVYSAIYGDIILKRLCPSQMAQWAELFATVRDQVDIPAPYALQFKRCGCVFEFTQEDLPISDLMCEHGTFLSAAKENVAGNVFVAVGTT